MDSCLIILEQKDDAFISKLQLTMKDQASSSIEKEEMPFKSSEILPVDRGSRIVISFFSCADSIHSSTCGWQTDIGRSIFACLFSF